MPEPRYWKTLKRHPLGAEYPDLDRDTREAMIADVKEFGVLGNRPVTLHDGEVIDGWQLYQACLAAEIKPTFRDLKLPKGMTAEQWVEIVNDRRRHETAQDIQERAAKRRERVAAARAEGQSIRTIAEAEGVSKTTVAKDLNGSTVHPGTVLGKDGRTQPASRILCKRCQRVGETPDCKGCKVLRSETKRKKARDKKPDKPTELVDPKGLPVPRSLKQVYGDGWLLDSMDTLAELARLLREERFCSGAKGKAKHFPFFNSERFIEIITDIDNAFDVAIDLVRDARPLYVCPECKGEKCSHCLNSGLVPKWQLDKLKKK